MVSTLINLDKYPLDRPDSTLYKTITAEFRTQLSTRHYVNMEDFLNEHGTAEIAREIDARAAQAFHSERLANPYGKSAGDREHDTQADNAEAEHPSNLYAKTDRYGLARHQLKDTLLDSIYNWAPMKRFVGDILGLKHIYLHEDPSNALVVQIYKPGGGLAWHFDRALFSTILNIRETDKGGVFECAPNLRSDTDPCFDEVRKVALGQSARVQRHHVKSGSFTVMLGRYTMHRVTENLGSAARYSAVLSYEDKPGIKLDSHTRQIYFGPTAPAD